MAQLLTHHTISSHHFPFLSLFLSASFYTAFLFQWRLSNLSLLPLCIILHPPKVIFITIILSFSAFSNPNSHLTCLSVTQPYLPLFSFCFRQTPPELLLRFPRPLSYHLRRKMPDAQSAEFRSLRTAVVSDRDDSAEDSVHPGHGRADGAGRQADQIARRNQRSSAVQVRSAVGVRFVGGGWGYYGILHDR